MKFLEITEEIINYFPAEETLFFRHEVTYVKESVNQIVNIFYNVDKL